MFCRCLDRCLLRGHERPITRCRGCAPDSLYVAGVRLNRIGTVYSIARLRRRFDRDSDSWRSASYRRNQHCDLVRDKIVRDQGSKTSSAFRLDRFGRACVVDVGEISSAPHRVIYSWIKREHRRAREGYGFLAPFLSISWSLKSSNFGDRLRRSSCGLSKASPLGGDARPNVCVSRTSEPRSRQPSDR
jgi:hypothetical protein